ncbi:MAG TPA: nuclear transport factor 2 family protein [Candidatus Krumholzibacteria bacterium]|nr:nuclear transport factor 2 family protein [Candidatus Krumholzibacteria bacterium]
MRRLAPALLLLALCSACQKAQVVDLVQEEKTLRYLSSRWATAMEARDVDSICPLFARNAIEMQANTPPIKGSEAICTWYRGWLLDPNVTGTFAAEGFDIATSGDFAVEHGNYTFTTKKGDTTLKDQGKYLTVWTRVDGQWKVLYDTANTNLPLVSQ